MPAVTPTGALAVMPDEGAGGDFCRRAAVGLRSAAGGGVLSRSALAVLRGRLFVTVACCRLTTLAACDSSDDVFTSRLRNKTEGKESPAPKAVPASADE